MATRIDPNLMHEIKEYGAVGIEKCFNCGNCTAICPLTSDVYTFPRNMIRLAQLGLEKRLLQSTDPWLCYYCGDCAETCPREAEPGETMMALRRWLTDVQVPNTDQHRCTRVFLSCLIRVRSWSNGPCTPKILEDE